MAVKADVFAGSIAAELTTKALLHPLDTIKTRLQYTVVPKRQRAGASSIPVPAFVEEGTSSSADSPPARTGAVRSARYSAIPTTHPGPASAERRSAVASDRL